MRVAGGRFKNHPLSALGNTAQIRPTSDKVRQAVFNMLESRGLVDGATALDAFCGTGALGIEALSRGASFCTFWDKSPHSVQICKKNISNLGLEECSKIDLLNAAKCPPKPQGQNPANLVFLDPPYDRGLVPLALGALVEGGWISAETAFVIELSKKENPDLYTLDIVQDKLYGDTRILIAETKAQ